jgi:uncharacterized membrane protein YoaK (UPF0700 family)
VGDEPLPTVLSVTAGSADVISFLGLGGLFVAHITGNLVLLAAYLVTGTRVAVALLLSVPLFVVVLPALGGVRRATSQSVPTLDP